MLSKEIFIETLQFIYDRQLGQEKMHSAMKDEFEDAIFWPYSKYESQLIKVLEDIFDDKNGWISWYIYEADFGQTFDCAYESDGSTEIPLKTPEDLYKFLVENMSEDIK